MYNLLKTFLFSSILNYLGVDHKNFDGRGGGGARIFSCSIFIFILLALQEFFCDLCVLARYFLMEL